MNHRWLRLTILLVAAIAFGALIACSSDDSEGGEESAAAVAAPAPPASPVDEPPYELTQAFDLTVNVTTTSYSGGFNRLNKDHSCEGLNISPDLSWEGVPAETKSIAILFDDPKSDEMGGEGMWTHWVIYSIPPAVTSIDADQSTSTDILPFGAKLGRNDYGNSYYRGPCPTPTVLVGFGDPVSAEERPYYFRLYALDKEIDLQPGASRNALLREIDGHIIAGGEAVVLFRSTIRKCIGTVPSRSQRWCSA